jgi:peptidoglycan hydrolase FlgJ
MDALSTLSAAAKLPSQAKAKIDKTAEDFEAVFLSQMLEQMFADVDLTAGYEGPGEDVYKSFMLDEYGKIIAKSGGIGIADHIRREMLKMQETL